MIRVCNLKKSFGDNQVLNGIDYEVNKGDKIVVVLKPQLRVKSGLKIS